MGDRSGGASALLGMEGFVVLAMERHDDEWWLLVETEADVAGCPTCGVRAIGHGRTVVQIRDLPMAGVAVRLVWRKRRWRCGDPDCERRTFSEQSPLVDEGCLTRRARAEICRRVGQEGHSVASVARAFGVGWSSAMAAVRDHGLPLVEARALGAVEALGVDEHKMLAAGPRRRTTYCTQLVDLDSGRLLDVVPGRSARSVTDWLEDRGEVFCRGVAVAAIDPHAGYARAIRATLPRATLTVDPFHVVKLANGALDDVRRRVQRETLGHRGRKDDPLFGIRRLLTRGFERLSDRQEARLAAGLRWGDPFDEVGMALVAKEELRAMYATATREPLDDFYALAARSGVPEVARLARTVARWEDPILAFFDTGRSNAHSEAANLITEKLRRIAHGLRNFDNYRLRLLLHSGVQWDTPTIARIRGRHPRLVA